MFTSLISATPDITFALNVCFPDENHKIMDWNSEYKIVNPRVEHKFRVGFNVYNSWGLMYETFPPPHMAWFQKLTSKYNV